MTDQVELAVEGVVDVGLGGEHPLGGSVSPPAKPRICPFSEQKVSLPTLLPTHQVVGASSRRAKVREACGGDMRADLAGASVLLDRRWRRPDSRSKTPAPLGAGVP